MEQDKLPEIELQKADYVKSIDFLGNDFAIFESLHDLDIPYKCFRINASVFAICTEGGTSISINEHVYRVKAGQIIAILPDSVIRYDAENDNAFKGLFIAMNPQFTEEILPKLDSILPIFLYVKEHPCTNLTADEMQRLTEFHTFLWQRLKISDIPYKKEITLNLLKALVYEVSGIFDKHIRFTPEQSRQSEIFSEFIKLCARYFRTERSLQFYADKLYISPKYLSVVVKQASNKTASEWIDDYVVNEAKTLLKTTTKTIQEISYELNFANQSFFGKFFKRKTGVTPGHFKRS